MHSNIVAIVFANFALVFFTNLTMSRLLRLHKLTVYVLAVFVIDVLANVFRHWWVRQGHMERP